MLGNYSMIIIKPGVEAKKGDRVKLADKKGRYIPHHSNPTIGSDYECSGTIREIRPYITNKNYRQFVVIWDNGKTNGYNEHDLVKDLSELGNINSIW
jgi:hypothetical protein